MDPAKPKAWTAEQRLQLTKERVTAVLAFLLVASTLVLTFMTFDMAGQESKMQDALGVLTLMFGLAGVVVGYYFGRVPGDARAVESHEVAMVAMSHMSGASVTPDQTPEKTQEIRAHLDADMDKANKIRDKLGAGGRVDTEEIQQLVDAVRRRQKEISELLDHPGQ